MGHSSHYDDRFYQLTLVGYGDMYPKTLPGRILAFFLCIWGVFITSLLVVTLTNYVTLTPSELKALKLNDKLEDKGALRTHAGKSIYYFCRMVLYMKRNDKSAEKQGLRYLTLLMQSLAKFKKTKRMIENSMEGMMNQSDLVSMIESLHKGMRKSKENQDEISKFNEKCSKKIAEYYRAL